MARGASTSGNLHRRLPANTASSSFGARIEQRVLLEDESGHWRTIHPDAYVIESPRPSSIAAVAETAVAIEEEPVLIIPQGEPLTEGYIEIVDAESGNRVVTVIEFLSPTNKLPGFGREQYQKKQGDVVRGGANLVEIDLNRSGQRALALDAYRIPADYRTTYQICVWRSNPPSGFEVYRAPLSAPLAVDSRSSAGKRRRRAVGSSVIRGSLLRQRPLRRSGLSCGTKSTSDRGRSSLDR